MMMRVRRRSRRIKEKEEEILIGWAKPNLLAEIYVLMICGPRNKT